MRQLLRQCLGKQSRPPFDPASLDRLLEYDRRGKPFIGVPFETFGYREGDPGIRCYATSSGIIASQALPSWIWETHPFKPELEATEICRLSNLQVTADDLWARLVRIDRRRGCLAVTERGLRLSEERAGRAMRLIRKGRIDAKNAELILGRVIALMAGNTAYRDHVGEEIWRWNRGGQREDEPSREDITYWGDLALAAVRRLYENVVDAIKANEQYVFFLQDYRWVSPRCS